MKILFITRQFYPCIGGTESATFEMASRLVKRGHQIGILTLNQDLSKSGSALPREEKVKGIQIYRVPFIGPKWKPIPVCNPFYLKMIFKKYDVIHIKDIRFALEHSVLARWIFKKPVVISSYGFIFHQKKNLFFKNFFFKHYLKPLFRFSDFMLASTDSDYVRVQKFYPKDRLLRMDLGVDSEKFSVDSYKPEKGRFLYFGRLDHHKGVDLLFETLSKLTQSFSLDLVYGSAHPDYFEQLKGLEKKFKIETQLNWIGYCDHARLMDYIKKAQFVVLPSRYEGFGLTTLEAMSAGSVPIANHIEAFSNLIDEDMNGYLVNFNDPKESAKKIDQLIGIPFEQWKNLSREARKKAKLFDWETRINDLEGVYGKLRYGI